MEIENLLIKPVAYHVSGMENVIVQRNKAYQKINDQEYYFDVYSPSDSSINRFPAVILIHGEAPINNIKDTGQYTSLGSIIAATGLVAVTFDHRTILTGAKISDVCYDIQNLIAYIRKNSEELNIDDDNIAVWSFSGGVPFGLNVSFNLDTKYLKGLVMYYGPIDFESLSQLLNIKFDKHQSIFESANNYPDKIPPLFIARAGLDMPVINSSINQFIETAFNLNLNVTICNHATGHHAFDILDDSARTREILGMTLSFLAKNLLNDYVT